jgi:predicted transcriptional regulator
MNSYDIFNIKDINHIIFDYKRDIEECELHYHKYKKVMKELKINNVKKDYMTHERYIKNKGKKLVEYYKSGDKLYTCVDTYRKNKKIGCYFIKTRIYENDL